MQSTKLATALAIAVAVTGSSTGFAAPGANHELDPVARATWSPATTLQPAGAATPGIAMGTVNLKKVTAYNLNLRQGRSTATKVLVMIPKNTAVTVTETSGSWSKTSYRGKTGWVASRYLENAAATRKTTT
ncbi:SH3 domain-containing protein [Paeniglutamicibacter sp. ABSL32-1]|uniref:SH3 domain-containing protein n=1 Tax=Paeniglutamicibacter quisquiliarum TaxID=2849498 RepID=UPI001C2D83E1|nr:SH3 domain-containing protein [Paeniglutamicibacter quisquiliarum]MBV1778733.1 SH3 domain-containing protein [Paeniglutamicibacter quisquiliarum]